MMENKTLILAFAILVLFTMDSTSAALSDELRAYYNLDELSGSVIDRISGQLNAINFGATTGVIGILETAYQFDGINDYLNLSREYGIYRDGNFTINFWVKANGWYDNDVLISPLGEANLNINVIPASRIRFEATGTLGAKGTATTGVLQNNTWYMITAMQNSSGLNLFVNGALNHSDTSPGILNTNTAINSTIASSSTLTGFFNGTIDEVGFWNRSLTYGEVQSLYAKISPFFNVYLISPENDSTNVLSDIEFNATLSPANGFNNSNATIYIWNEGVVFNQTTNLVTGDVENSTSWDISGFSVGSYEWNVLGCYSDGATSECGWAVANRAFTVGFTENSITYNATTYETSQELFILNTTITSGILSSATFYYNGVSKGTSTKTTSGGNTIFTNTFDIPTGTGSKDFYWTLNLDGTLFNTTTNSQTVNPIYLARCNATINVPYFNFTILEEGTLANLNASLEAIWTYWLGSGSANKSFTYSNTSDTVHNYGFCFSPSDRTVYITGINNYYSVGYDSRTYYFLNTSKNSASGNIDLYLLATADSDIVTFTVVDDFLSPVIGASIRILRWNLVTDTFYLVNEIVTGSGGTASSNLRLNDAFYKFVVSYNGITYLDTSPEKLASTTKTLQIFLQPTSTIYDTFKDIDYSLTFSNSTNIFTCTYNDLSSTIDLGCLRISQTRAEGTVILDETCESSPASTLTYAVTNNATYIAECFVTYNSPSGTLFYTLDTLIQTVGTESRFLVIGKAAQVISFIFVGTMAMIGVALGSIPLGLGLIIASSIVLNLIGFMNLSNAFIGTMVSIIILIVISLGRRFT